MAGELNGFMAGLSGVGSQVFELLIWVLLLGVIGMAVYAAARSGILVNRPHRVYVYAPRINGEVELINAKGRFIKDGKFEIWYGLNTADITEGPKEEFFNIKKEIAFVREDRDSYYPTKLIIDSSNIVAEPTNSNAAKIASFQVLREGAERFTKPNKWMQMLDKLAFIGAAIILFISIIYGLGDLSKKFDSVANSLNNIAGKFDRIDKITFRPEETQTAAQQPQNTEKTEGNAFGIPLGFIPGG